MQIIGLWEAGKQVNETKASLFCIARLSFGILRSFPCGAKWQSIGFSNKNGV